MSTAAKNPSAWLFPTVCLLIAGLYLALANLKGIDNDEGFRLGIINGGQVYSAAVPGTNATWSDVIHTNAPYAYQPLYFLLLNSVMRVGHTHNEFVLKCVNVFFLWLALQGLLALTRSWQLVPRLFLLGLFGCSAYLLMHVLQLREYIVAIAFYVWSSWFALELDRRQLGRGWADAGWFVAYGVLLVLGFYTTTWAVMPAVAQGMFLVFRRQGQRWRCYANLVLTYSIVLASTIPYLRANPHKVDIGRWGSPQTPFFSWMGRGIHYALTGQYPNEYVWAEVVLWCWLGLLVIGALLFAGQTWRAVAPESHREAGRTGRLMLISLAVTVAFQVVYFLKVDTLSVWPRYFALHYLFMIWLVALAFQGVHALATGPELPEGASHRWRLAMRTAFGIMVASALLQIRSYCLDPYLDTSLTPTANWRVLGAGLARDTKPGDAILTQDFLHAWTLSFSRPTSLPVLYPAKLDAGSVAGIHRVVYLEHESNIPARAGLAAKLAGLGFVHLRDEGLRGGGAGTVARWRVLIFSQD